MRSLRQYIIIRRYGLEALRVGQVGAMDDECDALALLYIYIVDGFKCMFTSRDGELVVPSALDGMHHVAQMKEFCLA